MLRNDLRNALVQPVSICEVEGCVRLREKGLGNCKLTMIQHHIIAVAIKCFIAEFRGIMILYLSERARK